MFSKLLRFLLLFAAVLISAYLIHNWLVTRFSPQNNAVIINLSYVFNGIYTLVLTTLIIVFHKKYVDYIGLLFLAGSFMKIGIFVVIVKWNGMELTRNVFLDFFIPYGICLILEVGYVAKLLNSMNTTSVS